MKRVFAVVLAYNSAKWIAACLDRLQASHYPVMVIVVDNASRDETPQILQQYPDVVVMRQATNLGFGGGNNLGMGYAFQHDADYIFLLNDDVEIEPGTIGTLITAAESHNQFGLLTPMQLDGNGTALEEKFAGFIRNPVHSQYEHFLADLYFQRELQPVYRVHFANAAAWFLRRECLETCGGFDPLYYPAYGEDNDLARRIQYHGWKIGLVPEARVLHHRQRATTQQLPLRKQAARDLMSTLVKLKNPHRHVLVNLYFWLVESLAQSFTHVARWQWRDLALLWLTNSMLLQRISQIWQNHRLCRQQGAHWITPTEDVS